MPGVLAQLNKLASTSDRSLVMMMISACLVFPADKLASTSDRSLVMMIINVALGFQPN